MITDWNVIQNFLSNIVFGILLFNLIIYWVNLSLFNYLNSKYPIISKGKMKLPTNIRRSSSFNINNYKKKAIFFLLF